jgi:hypothetical protein
MPIGKEIKEVGIIKTCFYLFLLPSDVIACLLYFLLLSSSFRSSGLASVRQLGTVKVLTTFRATNVGKKC